MPILLDGCYLSKQNKEGEGERIFRIKHMLPYRPFSKDFLWGESKTEGDPLSVKPSAQDRSPP